MINNSDNLTNRLQTVFEDNGYKVQVQEIYSLCHNFAYVNIGIAYPDKDTRESLYAMFAGLGLSYTTSEGAYKYYGETYNLKFYSGGTIFIIPAFVAEIILEQFEQENTTETPKTASESNDSMYPAIVTIGGENHGEVKPNPEYSENKLTRDYLAKLFAEFDRLHTKSFQEYKQNWIETHERPHYDYNNFFYGSYLIQRFNGGYKMNKASQLALFGKYYGKQRFYFRQNSNGYAEFGKMKQVAYGDDYESTILLTFRPEKS